MRRKVKASNKKTDFSTRFNEVYKKKFRTHEQLANALHVSRPTVSMWLSGGSTPDIQTLIRMTQLFGVSADYLLGLSDAVKPDVTLRAAMAYTGLSEEAVEWLHIGLDDFECDGVGLSEKMKQENLHTASMLIQSRVFTSMIYNLKRVEEEAYLERILQILEEQYSECDFEEEEFHYTSRENRKAVETHMLHVLKTKGTYWDESSTPDEIREMDDEELACDVMRALLSARDENELRQFHAAKAFSGYIDQLVEGSRKKAEQRFTTEEN